MSYLGLVVGNSLCPSSKDSIGRFTVDKYSVVKLDSLTAHHDASHDAMAQKHDGGQAA